MGRWVKGCGIGCGVLLLLLIAGVVWIRSAFFGPPPAAPRIGGSVALRPTFHLRDGESYDAGTAVGVRLRPGAQPILVTALHLLGTAGGYEREVAPGEIDRVVREVRLTTIAGEKPVATARGALRKSGPALTENTGNTGLDLAAFRLLPKARINALPLASANPRSGEWLWLVGDEVDHLPQTQRLFPLRVMFAADDGAVARLHQPVRLQAFSGAPLVNARGEVAGLLIGGSENGAVATFNPAGAIRARLAIDGIR